MTQQPAEYRTRTISLPVSDDNELTEVSKLMSIDRSTLLRLFMKEGIRRLKHGEMTFSLVDGKFE